MSQLNDRESDEKSNRAQFYQKIKNQLIKNISVIFDIKWGLVRER